MRGRRPSWRDLVLPDGGSGLMRESTRVQEIVLDRAVQTASGAGPSSAVRQLGGVFVTTAGGGPVSGLCLAIDRGGGRRPPGR